MKNNISRRSIISTIIGLSIFGSLTVQSFAREKWEPYTVEKTYNLISLVTKNTKETDGKIEGGIIVGIGSVDGKTETKEKNYYSFYIEKDGLITRKIVDYRFVTFKFGEPSVTTVQRKNIRTKTHWRTDGEVHYFITVPKESFTNFISVSHG